MALRIFSVFALILFNPFFSSLIAQDSLKIKYADQYFALGDSLYASKNYDSSDFYFEQSSILYKENGKWEKHIISLTRRSRSITKLKDFEKSRNIAKMALNLSLEHFGERHVATASSLHYLGLVNIREKSYKEAKLNLEKALEIRIALLSEKHLDVASTYNNLGLLHYYQRISDQAIYYMGKALQIKQAILGETHKKVKAAYESMVVVCENLGEIETALEYSHKYLKIELSLYRENSGMIVKSLDKLGRLYARNNEYENALMYFEEDLRLQQSDSTAYPLERVLTLLNLGKIYENMEYYNKTQFYYNEALAILKENQSQESIYLANYYTKIGFFFVKQNAYDQALSQFKEALRIKSKSFGPDHSEIATALHDLGSAYLGLNDLGMALDYYERALKITKSQEVVNDIKVGTGLKSIGKVYYRKGMYEKALDYYRQSYRLTELILHENDPSIADIFNSIGVALYEQGKFKESLEYNVYALNIFKSIYGEKHSQVASQYYNIANCYMKLGELERAQTTYQKSLISLVTDFNDTSVYVNPDRPEVLNKNTALRIIKKKGLSFWEMYLKENKIEYLENALLNFKKGSSFVEQFKQNYIRHSDKLGLVESAFQIHENGLKIAFLLYGKTKNKKYLEDAFLFAERGKSSILAEKLSENQAKTFASVPKGFIEREKSLQIQRSFYYSQIQNMIGSKDGYDSIKMDRHQNFLFKIDKELDSLKLYLENNHGRYFDYKYKSNHVTLSDAQHKLSENQALLEYFVGDSTIYAFSITKEKVNIHTVNKDSSYLNNMEEYMSSFKLQDIVAKQELVFQKFTSNGLELYQQLIKPALSDLDENIDHLIISPNAELSYMPWEVLITQKPPEGTKTYRHLDYLLTDYSVSYTHSANILFNDFIRNDKKTKKSLLAFAPSYPKQIPETTYAELSPTFRDELNPLKWNKEEINQISEYYSGTYMSGAEATEKAFKNQAGDYKILHLAMHALIDNSDPMDSKLVFTPTNDSIEDDMLHTYELFSMNLSAELAVLSACETGLGVVQRGEGVMSLGKAFSYAGCPSIIMSHWSVEDQSSAELMGYFYAALASGKSKDKALQETKLKFLAETTSEIKAHPFFWGGLVVVGNTDPISNETKWVYWIVGLIALVAAGLVIRKKMSI